MPSITVFKNKLLTKVDAPKNQLAHENHCIKRPSQLRRDGFALSVWTFFPSECPGLCRHRPRHSLGEKSPN